MSFAQPASVDDLLNYRLSRLLSSSGALVTRLCEGQYGITRREWRLICVVADHGAMSPSRLAELSHLERPRVSRHVADLVTKKILARVVDPSDRRRAWLEVTARGRVRTCRFRPQLDQAHRGRR
jgi:DNA-binding MarR family transcriptional regulator